MITIIDYKSGNLKSISNGFKKIGADYQITDDNEIIADSDYLVLPGVGAFGSAMDKEVIIVGWDNWSGTYIMQMPGMDTDSSELVIKEIYILV